MAIRGGKILIVEDEPKLADVVQSYLRAEGYQTLIALTGKEAFKIFEREALSLIILDLMLPDISGEEICQEIRKVSQVPIIMLTAKLQEESFLNGLYIGADDYITKPFSPRQLVAKVAALLRRAELGGYVYDVITLQELTLDLASRQLTKNGEVIDLTPSEYHVLLALMKHPAKTFTREELVFSALGQDYEGYDRMVDTYIKQLRQKIEVNTRKPCYIITVHGIGYRFGGDGYGSSAKK